MYVYLSGRTPAVIRSGQGATAGRGAKGQLGPADLDGGYIVAGYTNSFGAGHYDVYLIKTDANGSAGVEERQTPSAGHVTPEATIVRGVLLLGAGHDRNPPGISDRVPSRNCLMLPAVRCSTCTPERTTSAASLPASTLYTGRIQGTKGPSVPVFRRLLSQDRRNL